MQKMLAARALVSGLLVFAFEVISNILASTSGIVLGQLAPRQFSDDPAIPAQMSAAASASSGIQTLLFVGVLVLLVLIWSGPAIRLSKAVLAGMLAIIVVASLTAPPAKAYYDAKDYPEFIEVQPNQTALLIPEQGDTRNGQAAFMSEQYLKEAKVAMKRVQIPHVLIKNPGWTNDYYVPAARLLVVDRSPVSREWTASATRGTSSKDQGFRFETADSIGLSTSIVISAFVKEEDAAKFVYWFGAKTTNFDVKDPQQNFASVTYGKGLSEVIDDNVHRSVQAVLAREFGRRTTDDAIHQKADIMASVYKEVSEQFAAMGITITTIGYADQLNFDNVAIQTSIDRTYMAIKDAQSATAQQAVLPIQQALLDMDIRKMDAQARMKLAEKWNGSASGILPSWIVLPGDLMGTIRSWFGGSEPMVSPPIPPAPVAASKPAAR